MTDVEDPRRFWVWVGGTPVAPDTSLTAEEAISLFRHYLHEEPDDQVEIREAELLADVVPPEGGMAP